MFKKFQRPDDSELQEELHKHESAVSRTKAIIQSHMDGRIGEEEMVEEVAQAAEGLHAGEVVKNAINRMQKNVAIPAEASCTVAKEACERVSLFMKARQLLLGWFT